MSSLSATGWRQQAVALTADVLTRLELSQPATALERKSAEGIKTLIIALGPYGNLTTLAAAAFALHPHAIVLNHAGPRMLSQKRLDFLRSPTPQAMRAFVDAAVRLAHRGRRGAYGGNILKSHAFDDNRFADAYADRFEDMILKPDAHTLFWKESMFVTNIIRHQEYGLQDLINIGEASGMAVKFIQPVRHPVDCARSNLSTGEFRSLGVDRAFEAILRAVLDNLKWFLGQHDHTDGRSLVFREIDVGESLFAELCSFADLEPDTQWLDTLRDVFTVRKRPRSNDDLAIYRAMVSEIFRDATQRKWLLDLSR